MRKHEITEELINLSKLAKKLGFPQDVESGDWYGYMTYTDEIFLLAEDEMLWGKETEETATHLILSFSRCLEWIKQRGYECWRCMDTWVHLDRLVQFDVWDDVSSKPMVMEVSKTHHEAIAKAVVRILEEDNDKGWIYG